jgi:hypothetical protein
MASKLTQITAEKSAAQIQTLSKSSYRWFLTKIAELRNPSQIPRGINAEDFRKNKRFVLGSLYHFYYDPKGKADLPYYDRFPLVLALERYSDGFLGLNLHYLPIKYRMAFLNKLLPYAVLNDDNEIRRIKVTYDILQASRRFREFRPCIKRYLNSHIKSKILSIQPEEWETALFLPTHLFKGAQPKEIWKESLEEIRNS